MSFAFPALFIFLMVLPGILLRYSYRKGPNGSWSNPFVIQSLGDVIAWSLGSAAILHWCWIAIWPRFFHKDVDLRSALTLMVGSPDDMVKEAVIATTAGIDDVVAYFFG